jgi:biotin carboxylase
MKDVIILVNAVRPATFAALDAFMAETGRRFTPVVLVDSRIQASIAACNGQDRLPRPVTVLSADLSSAAEIRTALKPYEDRILAVTSQYENSIAELQKLVPYFPYLPMPSERSLTWATEKKLMRALLEAYDPSLVPGYMEVQDAAQATIKTVEAQLHYPMIVKPSGLEGSLLVSMVQNREDLVSTLEHTFAEIQKGYNTWIKRQKPAVLVEEFMEGDMYSVDTYVAGDGTCHHTPPVKVVTGRKVGFDDFFGYQRIAPAGLDEENYRLAHETAEKACHALGLRAVTGHVELMKTPHGWKVIELGPRIGGYRHDIYSLSYGINHIVNDFRNRAGELPVIPTEVKNHTVVFNIYARKEGMLDSIEGLDAVQALPSYISHRQLLQIGDEALFAKNNGDPVFEIILSNSDETQFKADMAELERVLVLGVRRYRRARQTAL